MNVAGVEMRAVLERLRRDYELRMDTMREAIDRTQRLAAQGTELRDRCLATRMRAVRTDSR